MDFPEDSDGTVATGSETHSGRLCLAIAGEIHPLAWGNSHMSKDYTILMKLFGCNIIIIRHITINS